MFFGFFFYCDKRQILLLPLEVFSLGHTPKLYYLETLLRKSTTLLMTTLITFLNYSFINQLLKHCQDIIYS